MTPRTRLAALIALAACACGTRELAVEQPAPAALRAHSVTLQYVASMPGVPRSASDYLQERMDHAFFTRDPAFGRGADITVRYRFTNVRGAPVTRIVLGPRTVVEAEILDANGKLLARVRSQQDISFPGAVLYPAIDRAVAEIREYVIAHFQPS